MLISKLYIDKQVADSPEVGSIRSHLNVPAEIVTDINEIYKIVTRSEDPVSKGKQILLLTRNKGAFLRDCPGTRHYTCCNYKILNIATYCTMDCSYCILQSYFHPPLLQYFVNHDDLISEIDDLFSRRTVSRIGTGEYTDSLIWEPWTDLNRLLVSKFSTQSRAILELKTKTVSVNGLKNLEHNRKTIVSWSLNSKKIIRSEERFTAPLSSRFLAAAKCASWGYPLAFHFDPLVIYKGWEEDYRRVIKQLFASVTPENIVWISLGSFRFLPPLKSIIQKRFPDSRIIYGELISGLDGKMRYFKPLRIELYHKIIGWIKEYAPDVLVYLCMEDDDVWQKALGFIPSERGGLGNMLDESARLLCGLDF